MQRLICGFVSFACTKQCLFQWHDAYARFFPNRNQPHNFVFGVTRIEWNFSCLLQENFLYLIFLPSRVNVPYISTKVGKNNCEKKLWNFQIFTILAFYLIKCRSFVCKLTRETVLHVSINYFWFSLQKQWRALCHLHITRAWREWIGNCDRCIGRQHNRYQQKNVDRRLDTRKNSSLNTL